MPLPVEVILPELAAHLGRKSNAVLIAPPGAGKTTMVASFLLNSDWCEGRILLLSPRRLAARAAAERIAELRGEPVGRSVGYATRMDSKQSANTRILVLTEGIFRNMIQEDPELKGISAVLFDEVHERSLDSDFGLALALDAQAAFRPDLRLLAMSATLDGSRFSDLMGDAPTIESEGRSYPLDHIYVGGAGSQRIEDGVASATRRALAEQDGDILVFLPGVREIERTGERLSDLGGNILVLPLHGSLDPAQQRRAIRPDSEGRRKILLATSIAETSLTIDGVSVVVDSGLARRPRYDRAVGMTRLVTERASQAAVTQRAGRAARQRPGVVYRLWEEAATSGLPQFDPPEISESDLAPLLLECAKWGEGDPRNLRWLDPPTEAAILEARKRLQSFGALDNKGRITAHGEAMAAMPMPPRFAHMLIKAGERGQGVLAAKIAVLCQERGLGGRDVDLERRLSAWGREKGVRAKKANGLAQRWSKMVGAPNAENSNEPYSLGAILALAFPDRLSKRRGGDGENWVSRGGRGFRLDTLSSLAKEDWLAVGEVQGMASGARILSAIALTHTDVTDVAGSEIEEERRVRFRPENSSVEALRVKRLGAITISSGPDDKPDGEDVATALLEGVRTHGLDKLPWSGGALSFRQRAVFAGIEELGDIALIERLDEWLPSLLEGKRKLSGIDASSLRSALETLAGWDQAQAVHRTAPAEFTSPAGTTHKIDYSAEAGPTVELRVQALFGLDVHPLIGSDRIPLIFSLTSPAGRPIQTTQDLPGFWRGSWEAVAKEMRGRYPKHAWPDDPTQAAASLKTKKAQSRAASRKG